MKYFTHLAFICLIAFAVRCAFIWTVPQMPVEGDAGEYDAIAVNIAAGHGFGIMPGVPTPVRAPFYPLFLAAIYAAFGHSLMIVRIVQAVLGALTCAAAYGVARRVFGNYEARLSAWATALYPALIAYCGYILSETLFTFLFSLSMLFLVRAMNDNEQGRGAFAGVFMGLATLTRPTTMLLPAFVAGFIITVLAVQILNSGAQQADGIQKRLRFWRISRIMCLFAVISYLTIVPWTVRNYLAFHKVIPVATGGGFGLWATAYAVNRQVSWSDAIEASHRRVAGWMGEPESVVNGYHPRIQLDEELLVEGKAMLRGNYGRYMALMISRLPRFWLTSHSSIFGIDRSLAEYRARGAYGAVVARGALFALQALMLIFAVAGIIAALRDGRNVMLLAVVLFYFCGHIAVDPLPRYHVPVLPYAFMFAIYGATRFIFSKGKRPCME